MNKQNQIKSNYQFKNRVNENLIDRKQRNNIINSYFCINTSIMNIIILDTTTTIST